MIETTNFNIYTNQILVYANQKNYGWYNYYLFVITKDFISATKLILLLLPNISLQQSNTII